MTTFKLDDSGRVEDTPALRALLSRVNREINRLPYKTDLELYGRADYWTDKMDEVGAGDCDDYALTKRRRLIELGVPWQCLSPAICTIAGSGHAVLLCRTSKEALVLDNNSPHVKSWQGFGFGGFRYVWISWLNPVKRMWFTFT